MYLFIYLIRTAGFSSIINRNIKLSSLFFFCAIWWRHLSEFLTFKSNFHVKTKKYLTRNFYYRTFESNFNHNQNEEKKLPYSHISSTVSSSPNRTSSIFSRRQPIIFRYKRTKRTALHLSVFYALIPIPDN